MNKAVRRTTQNEAFAMGKLLEQHLILPTEEMKNSVKDRIIQYKEGFNDDIIAKMVSPELTLENAKYLRQNLFGRLGASRGDGIALKRVTELENELRATKAATAEKMMEIVTKFNRLIDGMMIARVGVDCKHLKINAE
jgi:hypothetical protein